MCECVFYDSESARTIRMQVIILKTTNNGSNMIIISIHFTCFLSFASALSPPPQNQKPRHSLLYSPELRRTIMETVASDHQQQRSQSLLQKLNPVSYVVVKNAFWQWLDLGLWGLGFRGLVLGIFTCFAVSLFVIKVHQTPRLAARHRNAVG